MLFNLRQSDGVNNGQTNRGYRAAFLDRDGVLNIDRGYTHRIEDLVFTPTAMEAVKLLKDAGYRVIVATNQSGVARGLYTERDVEAFHAHMQDQLNRASTSIDAFYYCAFHPQGSVVRYARDHKDRKPSPGMLLKAITDYGIDPSRSFMIGDKESDMMAAQSAGLRAYHVKSNECDLAETVRTILADEQ